MTAIGMELGGMRRAGLTFFLAIAIGGIASAAAAAAADGAIVQVGSFRALSEAQTAMAQLRAAHGATLGNLAIEIQRATLENGTWHRLRVGPFANMGAAATLCDNLKFEGADCFVVTTGAASISMPARSSDIPPVTAIIPLSPEGRSNADAASMPGDPNPGDGDEIGRVRSSAELGEAEAQFALGRIYDHGWGAPVDDATALYWYRQSASQGFGKAQFNLAAMYGNGEGVDRDFVRAYFWFVLSEALLSGTERDLARENQVLAARSLTPEQIRAAEEMARRCRASNYQDCD